MRLIEFIEIQSRHKSEKTFHGDRVGHKICGFSVFIDFSPDGPPPSYGILASNIIIMITIREAIPRKNLPLFGNFTKEGGGGHV